MNGMNVVLAADNKYLFYYQLNASYVDINHNSVIYISEVVKKNTVTGPFKKNYGKYVGDVGLKLENCTN